MAYRVVCISPTDGSDGEQVGPIVARELGFQLVNEQIVVEAAREAGVGPEVIADAERRKSTVDRLLDRLGDLGPAGAAFSGYTAIPGDSGPNSDDLRGLISTVLWETAERGNAVIVTHAASLALASRADVLRVLITASQATRVQRIAEARIVDEAEAEKLVARGDANRADYLKRFYDVSTELPAHYDLVLNTDHITVDEAAALVLDAARSAPASG